MANRSTHKIADPIVLQYRSSEVSGVNPHLPLRQTLIYHGTDLFTGIKIDIFGWVSPYSDFAEPANDYLFRQLLHRTD